MTCREPGWLDGNYWTGYASTCDAHTIEIVLAVAFFIFWLSRFFAGWSK